MLNREINSAVHDACPQANLNILEWLIHFISHAAKLTSSAGRRVVRGVGPPPNFTGKDTIIWQVRRVAYPNGFKTRPKLGLSVQPFVQITNNYSKNEKPWYIKHCTEEEVIKGITRPKTCGGFQ